jgi:glycosyltransferase involved in cell wall biosynthesis
MISLIVPTRNRAHTLRKVLPSYFSQAAVSELIFVSDAGTDDSKQVIENIAAEFPMKLVRYIRNESRQGASICRNIGVSESTNDYVLFCDDDEFLEARYAEICLAKLVNSDAGAVSGRRVYMQPGESREEAVRRFGFGMRDTAPFRFLICEYVNGARYTGDIELPFTNAIILTRRELVEKFPFDGFYAKGNGYREETDFQMNLFVNNIRIIVTNDCHSIHLPISEVRSGGQRTSRLRRIYWSIYYTDYFFKKYYAAYSSKVNLRAPKITALCAFAAFAIYRETVRPILYDTWIALVRSKRSESAEL